MTAPCIVCGNVACAHPVECRIVLGLRAWAPAPTLGERVEPVGAGQCFSPDEWRARNALRNRLELAGVAP